MKKTAVIIAIIVGICLVLNSAVVFAADNTKAGNLEQKVDKLQQKAQNLKNWNDQIRPLLEQTRTNRADILKLRSDLLNNRSQVKSKIEALRQQKDSLTDEQVAQLKACLEAIKADKTDMKNTIGSVHNQLVTFRAARTDRDIDKAKAALQQVLNIQQQRIDLLNKGIADLQKVLSV
jgi:Spy/CpxP family protein refolding chaperone